MPNRPRYVSSPNQSQLLKEPNEEILSALIYRFSNLNVKDVPDSCDLIEVKSKLAIFQNELNALKNKGVINYYEVTELFNSLASDLSSNEQFKKFLSGLLRKDEESIIGLIAEINKKLLLLNEYQNIKCDHVRCKSKRFCNDPSGLSNAYIYKQNIDAPGFEQQLNILYSISGDLIGIFNNDREKVKIYEEIQACMLSINPMKYLFSQEKFFLVPSKDNNKNESVQWIEEINKLILSLDLTKKVKCNHINCKSESSCNDPSGLMNAYQHIYKGKSDHSKFRRMLYRLYWLIDDEMTHRFKKDLQKESTCEVIKSALLKLDPKAPTDLDNEGKFIFTKNDFQIEKTYWRKRKGILFVGNETFDEYYNILCDELKSRFQSVRSLVPSFFRRSTKLADCKKAILKMIEENKKEPTPEMKLANLYYVLSQQEEILKNERFLIGNPKGAIAFGKINIEKMQYDGDQRLHDRVIEKANLRIEIPLSTIEKFASTLRSHCGKT